MDTSGKFAANSQLKETDEIIFCVKFSAHENCYTVPSWQNLQNLVLKG